MTLWARAIHPSHFFQTSTFLLVTLIRFSKQGFVNSLTILFLYVYAPNLHWTKLAEQSCKWQWQRMYTMSYCYDRTWAVMALVDSIVVRYIRLDDYDTCIFISALALWPFIFLMWYLSYLLPPEVLRDCIGWGIRSQFFPCGFSGFRIRWRTPFPIVHFDL